MCNEHLDILVDDNGEAKNYGGTSHVYTCTCNHHIYPCIMHDLNFNKCGKQIKSENNHKKLCLLILFFILS